MLILLTECTSILNIEIAQHHFCTFDELGFHFQYVNHFTSEDIQVKNRQRGNALKLVKTFHIIML